MSKIFISGQISGLPLDTAKAAFAEAAEFVRSQGDESVSTFDTGIPDGSSWDQHMIANLKLLTQCDKIFMMAGWERSRGSRVEYKFAVERRMPVIFATNLNNVSVRMEMVDWIKEAIGEVFGTPYECLWNQTTRTAFFARAIFIHHCSYDAGIPVETIVRMVRRKRSTVFYAIKKYHDSCRYDPEFKELAVKVRKILLSSHRYQNDTK